MLMFLTFRYMKNFKAWKDDMIKKEKLMGTYTEEYDPNKKTSSIINLKDKSKTKAQGSWDSL